MRRSANGAARYAAKTGLSSRKHTRKWHYISGKSRSSVSLPTQNQRLARNLPIGLSKLGHGERPWIGDRDPQGCDAPQGLRLLIRSATNTYFSQVAKVISRPQAVDELAKRIEALWS